MASEIISPKFSLENIFLMSPENVFWKYLPDISPENNIWKYLPEISPENIFRTYLPEISPENVFWNYLPRISPENVSLKSPQIMASEIISPKIALENKYLKSPRKISEISPENGSWNYLPKNLPRKYLPEISPENDFTTIKALI